MPCCRPLAVLSLQKASRLLWHFAQLGLQQFLLANPGVHLRRSVFCFRSFVVLLHYFGRNGAPKSLFFLVCHSSMGKELLQLVTRRLGPCSAGGDVGCILLDSRSTWSAVLKYEVSHLFWRVIRLVASRALSERQDKLIPVHQSNNTVMFWNLIASGMPTLQSTNIN